MMKTFTSLLGAAVAAVALSTLPLEADARRLGGGKSAGMQRQTPPPRAADATPATPAQPGQAAVAPKQAAAPAAAGAAAAAGKRSWLGPIAGIAAGLGIAALMSHLGMGEAFGNMLTLLLLAVVAFVAIRWLMGRLRGGSAARSAGPQLAGAGAPVNGWAQDEHSATAQSAPMQRQAFGQDSASPAASFGSAAEAVSSTLPGFDAAGFERIAKMIFVRLQAANDSADIEDLRKFTTPELFASLRLDLQDRGDAKQQTDVVQLNARVVETTQEGEQQIVSVRFDGLIREEIGGAAAPFDEVWHLVRPADGSREWAIAGIAPIA